MISVECSDSLSLSKYERKEVPEISPSTDMKEVDTSSWAPENRKLQKALNVRRPSISVIAQLFVSVPHYSLIPRPA